MCLVRNSSISVMSAMPIGWLHNGGTNMLSFVGHVSGVRCEILTQCAAKAKVPGVDFG